MDPHEGRNHSEPSIDEVIASIRRVIKAGEDTTIVSPLEIPLEMEPFELPALFRAQQAKHSESLQDKSIPTPPALEAGKAEPAIPPRVLRTFKDTLIARMGQSPVRAVPSARQPAASGEGEDFCLRPMLASKTSKPFKPIVTTARDVRSIPRARFEHASFLLGRGATFADDDNASHATIESARLPDPSFDLDQTAALLRPLLRQWVDENMRQLVTKALEDEMEISSQTTDLPH